jgi:chordin
MPFFFIRGKVVCDDMVCPAPKPDCSQPIILEGECCASCQDDVLMYSDSGEEHPGCFFGKGDKKYHKTGTRWHPYIPPFGFSRCATCSCDANSLEVFCSSKECPRLTCPWEERIRPDKLACCMVREG